LPTSTRSAIAAVVFAVCLVPAIFPQADSDWTEPFPPHRIAGNLNFSLKLPNCDQMIASLTDIAVSSTSACSSGGASVSHVLQALGNDTQLAGNSIRITVGRFNTDEEINFAADYLVQKIDECRAALERQPA